MPLQARLLRRRVHGAEDADARGAPARAAPEETHHLIVTADPEKADGSGIPIDFSTVTPAEYEAQWWFFVDDRVRKVSFGGENVHILNTTDDEIPRSTDGVEWSSIAVGAAAERHCGDAMQ